MSCYARVIIKGSPISKSNFKMFNSKGRAILPNNSGKYHDRYANYEEQISYEARIQNPNIVLDEALIAILKVYYKSEKRHPDTNNITKSIFDGIEKSGLIVNDAQIRRIITEEYYDKENPRFELEFYGESTFEVTYTIKEKTTPSEKRIYSSLKKVIPTTKTKETNTTSVKKCSICNGLIAESSCIKADGGKTLICKKCFTKLF